ncbi:N-acetylmuramoyl-L-alanine amidase [Virgibacillus indicus]|uniref:N-acetylmuramoyl-L-alanine amidase n=1 Tax=Virgibacillus indicus TaxID=2024554 RepID=A0A265NDG6_9BACI|nr:N-acetylmuramoyl-L-alanine amidase [Virgibacillus indicus]OZU89857.1 N-acetylmuramoyl-L-alanine amidase [Virgibacillus indicus]
MQVKKTALFFIMFFSVFLFTEHIHADEAIINVDNLNIRNGPGLDYEQIGQANTDEVYQIVGEQDEWVEIQFNNNTGWVTTEYISVRTESNNESPSADTITIQYENTHIRSNPAVDSDIIHFAEKGAVFNVISEQGDWFEVENDEATGFINKNLLGEDKTSSTTGFKNKTIVIDAGHGGRDVGAIGAKGSYEKDIAYLTAEELAKELTILGAEVLLTRPEDEFISLGSRVSFANIMDTDAFISIHYNSVPQLANVNGIETYYYHEQYEQLANYIQKEIVKETDAENRGKTHGDYLVIRQAFKPSVLLELGFISNQEKEALLQTSAYQKKIVSGIINGLGKYFANE